MKASLVLSKNIGQKIKDAMTVHRRLSFVFFRGISKRKILKNDEHKRGEKFEKSEIR